MTLAGIAVGVTAIGRGLDQEAVVFLKAVVADNSSAGSECYLAMRRGMKYCYCYGMIAVRLGEGLQARYGMSLSGSC